jgi:galactokinase
MQGTPRVEPIATSATSALREKFQERFHSESKIFRAPGRVNLIGEHTDYNDGFVMPAAIGFYTHVAVGPRTDRKICVYSVNFDEQIEFELDALKPGPTGHWSDYVRGVAGVLHQKRPLRGANLVIRGDVPIGSGLSSSAAIEVSTGLALTQNSGINLDRATMARVAQQAEHEYAGAMCGIMDQFISCFGLAGHALMLDCRSLAFDPLPISSDVRIVICNTKVKHSLAGGEYNERRRDCEAGVRHLQRWLPNIRALRDVTLAQLEQFGRDLPEVTYRRCRHVISEDERVLAAAAALKRGNLAEFGTLMAQSHASLRDDYEVSCKELDAMVDIASKLDGVYGARMTGGGFGGCTVNLVQAPRVEEFKRAVAPQYERATGLVPEIYVCWAAEGAGPAPKD